MDAVDGSAAPAIAAVPEEDAAEAAGEGDEAETGPDVTQVATRKLDLEDVTTEHAKGATTAEEQDAIVARQVEQETAEKEAEDKDVAMC